MFTFQLPEIGEGVVEGEIVKWLVHEGDVISEDQPVAEVMTDKATIEITTPKSGRVVSRHGAEGDVVGVHTPLLDIDTGNGAAAAAPAAPAAAPVRPDSVPVAVAVAPPVVVPPVVASRAQPAAAPASAAPRTGKTLATPAVRSHARSAGVDIDSIDGSGKSGRVTKADIDAFVHHPTEVKAPPALPPLQFTPGQDERVRIIGLRRKIAEKMAEAYRLIPHFCYVDEVDATQLVALRRSLKPAAEAKGVNLTYLPFIMKALAVVFRQDAFRQVNANMDEATFELVVRGEINIGIATDSPQGLYVPVVKNVDQKSILQLAWEIADLTERTRTGKVQLDELRGGTFTITSVGNIGGRFATPIINHPEVAILGVNQIHDRPMVIDGQVVPRKMMYLSPSFDHRVIDGAVAARFVSALKAILEAPERLLLELR
jgi:pyruvate dehydrogenase E2 component (dihydrolipoamide acetyltransferase)